jgi:hypothetical protein
MNKCLLSAADLARRYAMGEPIVSIAQDAGVSRVSIWKRLRDAGVPRGRRAGHVPTTCVQCGRVVTRARWKAMASIQTFCSGPCYWKWMKTHGPEYVRWRQGQRRARVVVASYVVIPPCGTVHHHDGNNRNNAVDNLALFSSSAEHMSFHRGGNGTPIWDGRDVTDPLPPLPEPKPRVMREGPPKLTRATMLLEREIWLRAKVKA